MDVTAVPTCAEGAPHADTRPLMVAEQSRHPDRDAESTVTPTVSVVIACFNAAALIGRAIDSAARQTCPEIEIVVVDDASTDDSLAVMRAALARSGRPYRVIARPLNGGPSVARNAGVEQARGSYVAFLDADDEWLPDKLARQVRLMADNPQVTLCGCQAMWVDVATGRERQLFHSLASYLPDGWRMLLWRTFIHTSCVMARRDDLGIQPFDPALRVGEDRDLWFKLASNGSVALVPEPMVRIRVSADSYMARNIDLIEHLTRPMVLKHIASFGDVLTLRDKMRAHAALHGEVGRTLCESMPSYLRGARHLLVASLLGHRPVFHLLKLIVLAPPVRWLRGRWALRTAFGK